MDKYFLINKVDKNNSIENSSNKILIMQQVVANAWNKEVII